MFLTRQFRLTPACIFLAVLLTGCIGGGGKSSSIKYYVIDPVESIALTSDDTDPLAIEIIDLDLPQYLQRFHMASRRDQNRLHFSGSHQWGENLRKNLLRTLARNLTRMLNSTDIGTPLARSASLPDYRVQVYIDQFEQLQSGQVALSARWQISDGEENTVIYIDSFDELSVSAIDRGDYAAMVASMQELYGQLCSRIAGSILEQENG